MLKYFRAIKGVKVLHAAAIATDYSPYTVINPSKLLQPMFLIEFCFSFIFLSPSLYGLQTFTHNVLNPGSSVVIAVTMHMCLHCGQPHFLEKQTSPKRRGTTIACFLIES